MLKNRDGVRKRDARQARAVTEATISQTGDGVGGSVHWDGLWNYNCSFVVTSVVTSRHAGSFVFLVKIVENAIHLHIVRPSGEDSQEEGKE